MAATAAGPRRRRSSRATPPDGHSDLAISARSIGANSATVAKMVGRGDVGVSSLVGEGTTLNHGMDCPRGEPGSVGR